MNETAKQVLHFNVLKGFSSGQSDEHQRNWSEAAWKHAISKGNYDRSRERLNFEITKGGVIKALGIKCVIAKSYARIFFRNSINNGLLLIENADLHDEVTEGDTIDVEVNAKITHNGKAYPIASLPDNLVDILNAGGLVKAMRKLNGLD